MGWWHDLFQIAPLTSPAPSLQGAAQVISPATATATANQLSVRAARRSLLPNLTSWQQELWDAYEENGEFALAVLWRMNMLSRVRLRAAELDPSLDEPTILDDGPAADLLRDLGDVGEQSQLMASFSVYLDVPGEGWLVAEQAGGALTCRTCSRDEIRQAELGRIQVLEGDGSFGAEQWRDLATNHLVTRIWRPHKRRRHLAYSSSRAARRAIRELDLACRHIEAQYLSRLASAGLIAFPDEVSFPVRPEFADEPDPFVREWIETAAEAIRQPGTASAVIPIPIRMPAEYIDKIKLLDLTLAIDETLLEKREAARRRVLDILNVPADLLVNASSINHWGIWQLEEGALKVYITPDVEIIAQGLTVGYLQPRLQEMGIKDYQRYVVWYDISELVAKPDNSKNAMELYDRAELTGEALRRACGFDEADEPDDDELQEILLRKIASNPQTAFEALRVLTGLELSPAVSGTGTEEPPEQEPSGDREIPDRPAEPDPPETPKDTAARIDARLRTQAEAPHVVTFSVLGTQVRHPPDCDGHRHSCPYTHAAHRSPLPETRPGRSGSYACSLGPGDELVVGGLVFPETGPELPIPTNGSGSSLSMK